MLTKYQRMVIKIERIIELEYNKLDKLLMRNEIDQDTYDNEAREVEEWARWMYEDLSRLEVA